MALETLKGIKNIGGFELARVKWGSPSGNHLELNEFHNSITFRLQQGPVKERGVNGCQVDTLISAAREIIGGLNDNFPCDENKDAMGHLSCALKSLASRKDDRIRRGVEGESKA